MIFYKFEKVNAVHHKSTDMRAAEDVLGLFKFFNLVFQV